MNAEQLKKERMRIAYNLLQGLVAKEGQFNYTATMVEWAYAVAEEVLEQGGYVVPYVHD
jgi:hypothetical protein